MKKIKELPAFRRPREKLRERGAQALSDAELIAVIFGSGGQGQEVMTLATQVAKVVSRGNGTPSFEKITQIKGVGPAKASQIMAGFELARRYIVQESVKINGPESAVPLVKFIAEKQQEYFVCISLNGAHEVIETRVITIGLLNQAPVHPREVFADVIADRAAAVIFAHNHPSGDLSPSSIDLKTHKQLTEAGKILGIAILDHLIITRKGFYSFQAHGLL